MSKPTRMRECSHERREKWMSHVYGAFMPTQWWCDDCDKVGTWEELEADAPDGLSKEELALVLSTDQIKRLLDEHGVEYKEGLGLFGEDIVAIVEEPSLMNTKGSRLMNTKGWSLERTRDYLGY